jgi:hypothetical protein
MQSLVTHVQAGWSQQVAVENIGLGGARLVLDAPVGHGLASGLASGPPSGIAIGDALTLSFTAPTLWDPLVLGARVAWLAPGSGPRAAGVAFEHKATDAVFALYELIVTLGYE